VAHQKNLSVRSMPRHVQPTQHYEINSHTDSVEDLDTFPYLEHLENIADSDSQPPQPFRPRMDTYSDAGAPLSDYIAEPGEHDTLLVLASNQPNNPYYPFAECEKYKYIQCGIKKNWMKKYYDIVLKEENTALRY
jgi:hypothetical protein